MDHLVHEGPLVQPVLTVLRESEDLPVPPSTFHRVLLDPPVR